MKGRLRHPLLALMLVVPGGGCATEIGDSCSANVDCSPSGDRICDTSQLDGYCTLVGCGVGTCPEEAICIRFFPTAFLAVSCDPLTEDAVDPARSPTDHCTGDEICLSSGHCAPSALERRFCMRSCGDDDDCREGYECRRTGTAGAEPLVDRDNLGANVGQFCAQKLQ
jgi:hypothetical protein